MQPGDIIVAFNGEPVADASRLYRLLADSTVGSTATVRVIRGGRPLDLKIPVVSDSRARR
jgi:serine protease Do